MKAPRPETGLAPGEEKSSRETRIETMIEWGADLEGALERGRSERKAVLLYFGKDP